MSAEEKRLEREQRELERKQQELSKRLEKESRLAKEKAQVRMNVTMARHPSSIALGSARIGSGQHSRGPKRRLAGRAQQHALARFLILCLILATLLVMLWRAIPS